MRHDFRSALAATAITVLLSGCMGTGGSATDMGTQLLHLTGSLRRAIRRVPLIVPRPFSGITTWLDDLQGHYAQIEKEQRSGQQTASGAFDVDASMLGASTIMGVGWVRLMQK